MKFFKLKPAKEDYSRNMLPQTRKAVFFDVLHLQWKSLLLTGLILLLFYLPLLFSTLVKDMYVSSVFLAIQDAPAEEQLAASQNLIHLDVLRNVVNLVFIAIFCVAVSGTLRVIRQYAWGENVHMTTDFARGIRDNYRHTAAIGLLAGLIYVLCMMLYYRADFNDNFITGMLSLLPIPISALVVLPIFAIALILIPVYTNRLWPTLKNAFIVYCRSLLKTVGFLLCCLLIWVPSLLPNFYCHLFGSIAAVLLTPFALLAWTLYCYNRFDQFINPLVAPELIGKGLFPPAQ